MNGLQTLIDTWQLLSTAGDFRLYTNPTISLPSYIIVDPTPAIVGFDVLRAMGYAPPFGDQATAQSAMDQLVALGGTAAIPGILAQTGAGTQPPAPVAPVAPIVLDPDNTSTLGMVAVASPPPQTKVDPFTPIDPTLQAELIAGSAPETPIDAVTTAPIPPCPSDYDEGGPHSDATTHRHQVDKILKTTEPVVITPVATPIYATADDHAGLPHSDALAKLDDLAKLLSKIAPVTDDLRASVAAMAIKSIGGSPAPIVAPSDPGSRALPAIAISVKADGFKHYLMLGSVADLTESQAIELQQQLLKSAKFTRTPKLDPPSDADVAGFGEVWYQPISASHAGTLAWQDGDKLPVHNM